MAKKLEYTAEQFIKAIPNTGGIITAIARKVGCDWYTAKRYITGHASVKRAYDAERETIKDVVESSLITKAKEGEAWAVKYYLSTQAKDRGYVERKEFTGKDGGPVQHEDVGLTDDQRAARIAAILARAQQRGDNGGD